ncbi:disease resistance protein [Salix suchowensis]|nr:disease resistance protein [Salix suchowensis]
MLRHNDPVLHHDDRSFWQYTEAMDDGRKRCTFCGHEFAKNTTITRIKFHLAQVDGRGVRIYGQVCQDVQEAALAAIDGPVKKKLKIRAGSSNKEVTNAISASAHQQEDLSLDEDWMASITTEDMEPLERGSFHERPSFNQADEPRGDPSQPINDQLCSPSVNNDVIMNDAQNIVVQVLEQSNAVLDNLLWMLEGHKWDFRAWNKVGRKGEFVRI